MPDFSQRSYQPELIDDLNLSEDALAQNLRELAVTNRWLGGNEVTIKGLKKLTLASAGQFSALHLADLGCGGGDMLRTIARWTKKKALTVRLTGYDANAFMVSYARRNTSDFSEIDYEQMDIFSAEFREQKFDIVTMTLFCHHFTDEQLIDLLSHLRKQVHLGIVINDIHRHWLAYYSIGLLGWLFGASYLYRNDSQVSVLRAFRRRELECLINQAGFSKFIIRWRWAFRWEVVLFG